MDFATAQPCRAASVETLPYAGYDKFVPSLRAETASIYGACGSYPGHIERTLDARPGHLMSSRHKWFFHQNYGGMMPHYGQQYPDRSPPDAGANGKNSRAWTPTYHRVTRPV